MKKLALTLILTLASTYVLSAIPLGKRLAQSALSKNVFGRNDRLSFVSAESRLATRFIGRLRLAKGGYCTASLVGKDLILTNAHCLTRDEKFVDGAYHFDLGFNSGFVRDTSGVTKVWLGTLTPELDDWKNDWAILRLAKPLGKQHGYFGVSSNPDTNLPVNIGGYGNMFSSDYLTIQEGCHFKGPDQGNILHECDISSGDSGSPMFRCEERGCYIKALHSAERRNGRDASAVISEFDRFDANLAVQTSYFLDKLLEIREASEE